MEELQKQIGLLLAKEKLTAEEIAERLNKDIHDVMDALKEMLKMRLIVKEGTPPKYALAPHIRVALEEEPEKLLVHGIIEVESVDESLLKRSLEEIVEGLKKDFNVKKVAVSDIEQDKETGSYYGHIDVTVDFPNIESLFYFIFFYGPTVIEVLTTENLQIDPGDLQRAALLAAGMVQGYVSLISKLMTRKEIEEFNRDLLRRLYSK